MSAASLAEAQESETAAETPASAGDSPSSAPAADETAVEEASPPVAATVPSPPSPALPAPVEPSPVVVRGTIESPASGVDTMSQEEEAATEESSSLGLSFGVEVASAYVFRGVNVFQSNSQRDQNFLVAPAISYAFPGIDLSISYWGAYQLSGGNEPEMVRAGLGHEQDIIVAYDIELVPDTLSLNISLVWYFYPFATTEDAGTNFPQFLEPGVSIGYSGPLDLGLTVSYFAALQEELEDLRYTSIRPSIGKTFELRPWVSVSLGLTLGFKIFNRPSRMPDNVYDLQVDWAINFMPADGLTISPAVHFAWTNLEGVPTEEEYSIWWGIATGLDI